MPGDTLPKHVQASEDAANELVNQLQNDQNQPSDTQTDDPSPPAGQPTAQPAQPTGQDSDSTKQMTPEEEAALYKQRYNSLRGMYESQVPQYQEQIKFLQDLLAQTQGDPDQTNEGGQGTSIFGDVEIKEDEIKDYGSDFFDVVGRQARLATKEGFEQLMGKVSQLENALSELSAGQQAVSHSTFEVQLTNLVPNWREIDVNPLFLEWLNQPDEFTGQPKFSLLRSAVESGDAQRASVFFTTWLREQGQAQGSTQAAQPKQPTGMEAAAMPSVSHQPDAVTTAQAGQNGKVYTQQDIAQFYADVRRGKYNGRESEVQAIEADIQRAMVEGRLIA